MKLKVDHKSFSKMTSKLSTLILREWIYIILIFFTFYREILTCKQINLKNLQAKYGKPLFLH
jgi:ABC-type xylose transport system permease subunit